MLFKSRSLKLFVSRSRPARRGSTEVGQFRSPHYYSPTPTPLEGGSLRPRYVAANYNAQRLRAGREEADRVPPLRGGAAAEAEAPDWPARRGGRTWGAWLRERGILGGTPARPPRSRALGDLGVCGSLSSRPRQGPARLSGEGPGGTGSEGPGAAGGLWLPGEAEPQRHAPGAWGRARVGVRPAGGEAGEGQRGLTLSGGCLPPRVNPGPMPTLLVGFFFFSLFVKWRPRSSEQLRWRNGGTAECPDGMAQGCARGACAAPGAGRA